MKKELLTSFIDKYSLNGTISAVIWKINTKDKTLHTQGDSGMGAFLMDVTMKDFTEITEDIKIPIIKTPKVKSMLNPFGDMIAISLNKNDGGKLLGFTVTDNYCESYCAAAEASSINPPRKNVADTLDYAIEIDLNPEFVDKFLKARQALSDVKEFTVRESRKGNVEFVLGHTANTRATNTDHITITAPTVAGKDKFDGKPIRFVADNFVELLRANKEVETGGKVHLHPGGILKVVYNTKDFDCTYWQFALKK